MGTGEEAVPVTPSKATISTQETSTMPSYPDRATSMQAYYGAGATLPPFFTSAVASQTPHPYLWANQQSMMVPYGSSLQYPNFYQHGGFYAHPNTGVSLTNIKAEEVVADRKDSVSMKMSKENLLNMGLSSGQSGQSKKVASGSGYDAASQSAGSGSKGSSDASDEDANQREFSVITKKSFSQMLADVSAPEKPTVPVPATKLNNEMDSCNTFSDGAAPTKTKPVVSSVSSQVPSATRVGYDGIHDVQDERELKRLRRKQSNRDSARRSKLRKQAECDELQAKVEKMSNENHTLADELNSLAKQCEQLTSENETIMEELTQTYRYSGVPSNLQIHKNYLLSLSANGEDNSNTHDEYQSNVKFES